LFRKTQIRIKTTVI